MKSVPWICLSAVLATAPAAALAQPASPAPSGKAEGLTAAQKLNRSITDQNAAAAAREAAAQAAWRAEQAAIEQSNLNAAAKHDALVRANEAEAARVQAEFQARLATQAAEDAAKDRAYQARLAASRAAQAQYEKDLLDYKACLAGDRSKCKT